jgi:pimeloyl-ACP methyl ester carboxylesterase
MDYQSGYAPVDGLKIYYEVHGKGTPLVLLHGGGDTIETDFKDLIPLLARKYQVIAFERQGYGHTADIDRPFSFEQAAKDTVGLLKYLGIPKADLMGFSNGGHVALQAAISYPQAVRKLVLQSTFFSRDALRSRLLGGFQACQTRKDACAIAGGLPEGGARSGPF